VTTSKSRDRRGAREDNEVAAIMKTLLKVPDTNIHRFSSPVALLHGIVTPEAVQPLSLERRI
jgi:hypothetical protein